MTRWYSEKKKEHYYKEAKKQGYRARSAYKLKQIQKKFHIISNNDIVLDLGAAPGGWSQVAKEFVGTNGMVIGIDLLSIKSIDGVIFYKGDITKPSTIDWINSTVDTHPVNVVLSDMAPNISGNYSMDHAQSVFLNQHAFSVVKKVLANQGHFVCKIFMGDLLQEFIDELKPFFGSMKQFSPPASRKTSSEVYIVCKSFKKNI
jgi:23S rRNA (uridine2552-2'-O)-methyltransferase